MDPHVWEVIPVLTEVLFSLPESERGPLAEMIEHLQESEEDVTESLLNGSRDLWGHCLKLSRATYELYVCYKSINLLSKAVELGQEAMTLCPTNQPELALSCAYNLSCLLRTQYESSGKDHTVLRQAIDFGREALALSPKGHPNRENVCATLAHSLWLDYHTTNDERTLVEAIKLEREVLSLLGKEHPRRAVSCGNLAKSLMNLYRSAGDDSLLVEAIALERESLSLCPPGHEDRAPACTNLAQSLRRRYTVIGDIYLLIEAIDLEQQSLALRPPGHPAHVDSCRNLSNSLFLRHLSTGDSQHLLEAIALDLRVLSLHPEGSPGRATACANLANSLRAYYMNTDHEQSLLSAIELDEEALLLCPPLDPGRSIACGNLATSLRLYYLKSEELSFLFRAINLYRESLALQPQGHPGRVFSCAYLTDAVQNLYQKTGEHQLLDEICNLSEEGLSLSAPNAKWRSARDLAWLYLRTGSKYFNPGTAIQYLSQCLDNHPDSASDAVSLLMSSLDGFWTHANVLVVEHHKAMTSIYQRLIVLSTFLSNPALEPRTQLRSLRRSHTLGSDAFVNAVLAQSWSSGLENVEMAQAILWSQRLHYRDPELVRVPIALASELTGLLRTIASTPSEENTTKSTYGAPSYHNFRHNQVTRIHSLLQEIREIPGLERFMLGETFSTLCSVASAHHVVVLIGSRSYFYAAILGPSQNNCALIPLHWNEQEYNDAGSGSAQDKTRSHRGILVHDDQSSDDDDTRALKMHTKNSPNPINRQMEYLWINLVKPVLDHLGLKPSKGRARPRLHWCPAGTFCSLPLHAAGIHYGPLNSRICCTDYVVSSYTPTLTALLRAQKAMVPISYATTSITLVAEKKAFESYLQIIHGVETEVKLVAEVARSNGIQVSHHLSGSTTVSGACAAMQEANIVHLACHGVQDSGDAIQSGFCLGDGRLTISKLMDMRLDNAFLAFLSACETAHGDKDQPDQAMHLAAGMLFAGFKAVIATLWAISDIDGPKVAQWFYEELFTSKTIDSDMVAYALDTAIWKLRSSGVSIERWAPFIHMGA